MLPLLAAWTHEEGLPRRQGSQGFGTAQSQSIAEHERIQHVPPQHDTCQRGQSQFQGATRAPHISQVGPRGQSMGRGRGRGPQARTSGVQVRVYAVTPQSESADQPVIQGTFFYLAYGLECYLIRVLRIHSLLYQL